MNLSKNEQRVLHVLAQGGLIQIVRDDDGTLLAVDCVTRDGLLLGNCTVEVFRALKRKRLIGSHNGGPYRLLRSGRVAVRSQPDNR
ncbi:YjhX family toxin [Pararhodospirillum photometricum]|uniref:UPF0386 protein RSPPHO_01834 n=1 Tax=Pararhodospirillum photometricum DSM 122 TaxID=1150469 RepID=H6SKE5_PARPM|nr:YjhX family toxin [Pararhodospirillum photometricum]CCG08460.1 UPF0386 protein RC1_1783 [Pararhodospirillum photometricum DSM 122]